jgi:tRNA threonylcarbamoyladenosine biosynthesis protein TsaB
MRVTLALDASTYAGSVAVLRDGEVAAELTVPMRGEQEERLLPAVADALREAGLPAFGVDRIVCGAGPGSFTSLRIAASIAKGFATALEIPLYAISSLVQIAAGARPALTTGRYVAVLDAMRGDLFALPVDVTDERIEPFREPALASRADVVALAHALGARLIGPGETLDHAPHARGARLLGTAIAEPPPVDLATWEPVYGRLAEAQVRWEQLHGRALAP